MFQENLLNFLPTSKKELEIRNWNEIDIVLFSGDSYVDHPSFGTAIIGRVLENQGFRVAVVPQPNCLDDGRDFKKLGKPKLFFGVTSGAMDSMMNRYTAQLRLRSDDAFSCGNKPQNRTDYAVSVYCKKLKEFFPETPIIIGGIEASLRRFPHYDYWSNSLKNSILTESKADLLIYGMGEKAILEIAKQLQAGKKISQLTEIPQTAFLTENISQLSKNQWNTVNLFSFRECLNDKIKFAKNFVVIEQESNVFSQKRILQKLDNQYLVVNPQYFLSESELDEIYDLPYSRLPHPRYKDVIPAYEMIKFSTTIHRGCFGGCAFCALSVHQGKQIVSRSENSILKEIEQIAKLPDFKGYLSDLGGASANMYRMGGKNIEICAKCQKPSCVFPKICANLNTNHFPLIELYRKVRSLSQIKKVTIGSGVRYDLFVDFLHPSHSIFASELLEFHVSGRLKVAPEHTSDEILDIMRKPSFEKFKKFKQFFTNFNRKKNLKQELIPYFISSHPQCRVVDMANLAVETKNLHYKLEQIQDFTPIPMTLSSVIYYTGFEPYSLKKVHIPKTQEEKVLQRNFFFWYKKENQYFLKNFLREINRNDLIFKLFGK